MERYIRLGSHYYTSDLLMSHNTNATCLLLRNAICRHTLISPSMQNM